MIDASTTTWREALGLFERWVDATPADREALVAEVRANHPVLADRLVAMIDADRAAQSRDFLGEPVAAGPADGASRQGLQLGAWTLREPIGSGGMGEVWLAVRSDGMHGGRAAVKLLHATRAGAAAQARFRQEGETLARLAHPHIALLLDAGLTATGSRYLVLEYVAGERIDHWCDGRRLGLPARLNLFAQVCDAVSHAHAHLVVHRDLKPANILVTGDGHAKLLDFGVAKLLDDDAAAELTRAAAAGLTPEYAAPEQVRGEPVTTATDVYALGMLLFGLLTGTRPYGTSASHPAALARAIVDEEPLTLVSAVEQAARNDPEQAALHAEQRSTNPAALKQALRGDLSTIVAKAIRKAPGERYATVRSLADDLRRHLAHQPVSAQPDTFTYRSRKFVQRNRIQVGALALVFASLVAGLAAATWQWRVATLQAERTRSVVKVLTDLFGGLSPDESGKATVPVVELLQRGWRETRSKLARDDTLRAEVARPLGLLLAYSGDMAGAADALATHRGTMLREGRARGAAYLEVAFELGSVERRLGHAAAARDLFEEVIAKGPAEDAETASWALHARVQLGEMALDEGRLDDARRRLEPVAQDARSRFGIRHSAYMKAMDSLAGIARQQGRWADSRELFAAVVAATEGGKPFDATQARLGAAIIDVETGRYHLAVPQLQGVVRDLSTLLGDADTNTIYARTWLATALFHSGAGPDADAAIGAAHDAARASSEPEVRHAVQVVRARLQLRRGDLSGAEGLLRESLAFFEAGGPAQRRQAERARSLLGECLLRHDRAHEAVGLLTQAVDKQRALLGGPHPDLWPSLLLLALAHDRLTGPARAAPHYDEAQRMADTLLPPDHPDRERIRALADHARWRLAPGDEARRRATVSLDRWRRALQPRSLPESVSVLTNGWAESAPAARLALERILPLLDI